MKESELIKLFVIINKCYGYFSFQDEVQKQIWLKLLKDTPYQLAERNLERYLMNPENKRPPHPGILAETPTQSTEGRYIPGPEETRQMLEQRDQLLLTSGPQKIPEHVMERMRSLGYGSTSDSR